MTGILLTQYQGKILGPVAWLLGQLMNGIFIAIDWVGTAISGPNFVPNIGLAIIIFTVVIYMCLLPLTIKQQKFSKLQTKMNPELQEIQKKYKGKTDQNSVMQQQEEVKALYAKYGVSQTGSCVQLLIQMPILLALYRVIDNIPAYVTQVKNVFITPSGSSLVDKLISAPDSVNVMKSLSGASRFTSQFSNESFGKVAEYTSNTYVDVLNKASSADWQTISDKFGDIIGKIDITSKTFDTSTVLGKAYDTFHSMNSFLGINIGDSPQYLFSYAKDILTGTENTAPNPSASIIPFIIAIIIPVLAAVTQMINVKLMPTAAPTSNDPNDQAAQMANSMKTMNMVMPIMSAFFCFTLPAGMGLYWIAGSVIRSIQQVFVNKHIDKMDIDAQIEKNQEKYKKKLAKIQEQTKNMQQYANMKTRNVISYENKETSDSGIDRDVAISKSTELYESGKAKKGSLLSKANMVREFDEKNSKKK